MNNPSAQNREVPKPQRKGAKKNRVRKKAKSSPCPFNKLPSELLIAIFEQGERASRGYDSQTIPFPVLASHVCRLWRNVALDAATLWTDIRIYNIHSLHGNISERLYLERSKSCLLNFTICSHGTFAVDSDSRAIARKVSKVLLPHIGRVHQITLFTESGEVLLAAMALFQDVSAPCLQKLRISILEIAFRPNSHTLPPIFQGGSPNLRSVQVNGIACFGQSTFTKLTEVSLVRMGFSGESIQLETFVNFLGNVSETLTRLTLSNVNLNADASVASSIPSIELPALTSLYASGPLGFYLYNTPRLENLYLGNVDDLFLEMISRQFLSSKLQTLVSLKFSCQDLSGFAGKPAFFHGLPVLQELEMWECGGEAALLKHLMPKDALPLTNLTVEKKAKKGRKGKQPNRSAAPQHSLVKATQKLPETDINLDFPLPRLQFLTISEKSSWPLVQEIIGNRTMNGRTTEITRVRYTGITGVPGMGRWLKKIGLCYQFFDHKKSEDHRTPPHDLDWVVEEHQFLEDGEDGSLSDDSWCTDYPRPDLFYSGYDEYGGYHSDLGVGSYGFYNWSNYSGSD